MEILMVLMMAGVSLVLAWLLVVRNPQVRASLPKAVGLMIGVGLLNGAIFAGLIALINMLNYHTFKG